MNAKTDRWESYTDKAGRRHWRWPPSASTLERNPRDIGVESGEQRGSQSPRYGYFAPQPARSK
jgi:hypothetical protein